MAELSPLHAPHFAATKSAEEIARRLRTDGELIDVEKPCSWVAYYLPEYDTKRGKAIAACLTPNPAVGHELKRLIYENFVSRIRRYLKHGGPNAACNAGVEDMEDIEKEILPEELSTTLKVLVYLQERAIIQQETTADSITAWLQERVVAHAENAARIPKPPPVPRKRLCYICRLEVTQPFPSHPSMCIPCGAFNHASSQMSMPPRLTLPPGFTALVTGARINLGYHTVLRLLRCGGRVIATTRYPLDAISRYTKEPDACQWKDKLKVVGADFRSAKDAFELVHEVKQCLGQWANGGKPRLYALINNAAQTLTDSVKKERQALEREEDLRKCEIYQGLLIEGSYKARVRGGVPPLMLESEKAYTKRIASPETTVDTDWSLPEQVRTSQNTTTAVELYTKSSWVQDMREIPYEDVGSALSVNTFVPFILCRELLSLMGTAGPWPIASSETAGKPQGYIINVSSREGIFEDRAASAAKRGKHVHTNMSKAALNMLTETEAEPAWRTRRVAMNTVDPGYMSAAPEYEDAFEGTRPIGWEDGAGRVLWPIAVGEIEEQAIRGRFLKHYGAVEVDPARGR